MSEPITVRKLAMQMPVSDEVLADAAGLREGLDWALNATPEQWEERQAEARARRTEERLTHPRVPLDLSRLLHRLDWSRDYAEHLVQPYCHCSDSRDGWEYCQHARDEGVVGEAPDAVS